MIRYNKKAFLPIISFCGALVIFLTVLVFLECAPFGQNSLASMDASIQYLDFFSYYKDLIDGDASVDYSFGKTLGGTNIAVFSYYLASPLMPLVTFFEKAELNTFFSLLASLKIALCALTMSIFLIFRFPNLSFVFNIILSLSYGISQYNIAQSSNIMWLDGVIMLPLMLLGCFLLIKNNSSIILIISSGLSIIFNWYTGGINCLFSIFYFLYEYLINSPLNLRKLARDILKFGFCLFAGVLLSAFIFFPTVLSLLGGRGQVLGFKFEFTGNIISAIHKLSLGAFSSPDSVSLYCGGLPIIGSFALILSTKTEKRIRILSALFLLFNLLSYYFYPLEWLFSLLQPTTSYWFRHSYVSIALIIILAGFFFATIKDKKAIVISSFAFAITIITLDYLHFQIGLDKVMTTAMIAILYATAYYYMTGHKAVTFVVICIVAAADLLLEGIFVGKNYLHHDINPYITRVEEKERQIAEIKSDRELYRITQTSTPLTANYNEALAFNYMSISGYTSDPDNNQREFLDKLGYRINGENMCIVNTSIIPADSVLGVKYVISSYPITGLVLRQDLTVADNKAVYENPYALPLAFLYSGNTEVSSWSNSFEYINKMYSSILNSSVAPFQPVDFEITDSENGRNYHLYNLNPNFPVYGDIDWYSEMNAELYAGNEFITQYSKWLSPSVFYVPNTDYSASLDVELRTANKYISSEQFYQLDLTVMQAIYNELSQNAPDSIQLEDSSVTVSVYSDGDESLLLSIPYDTGWTVELNGEKISPQLFDGILYSIPLVEGENEIVMNYSAPRVTAGCLTSLVTLAGVIGYVLIKRKN